MIISKQYGLSWLPTNTDKGRWEELLRCALMDILHNECPVPQPLYDVKHLIQTEFDFDDNAREQAENLIEELHLQLRPLIERNGHWMMYNLVSISGNYIIQQLGDYRILEWEQGRGKVTPVDEIDDAKVFEEALNHTWGKVKHAPKPYQATVALDKPVWVPEKPNHAYLECNAVINGPGHTPAVKPDTNARDKWESLIAEDGALYEALADIVVLGNWKHHGICLLPIERGTFIEFIYHDKVGYLTIA